MAVKQKFEFTETTTILAVATGVLLLIDVILGISAWKDYTLKSNLVKAEYKLAIKDMDGAVAHLNKARAARPLEKYSYLQLGKILSDNGGSGGGITANQVYLELLGVKPLDADARIGYAMNALSDHYRSDPKVADADSLQSLLSKLESEFVSQALGADPLNMDARILKSYLNAERVLLRSRSGRWSSNTLTVGNRAENSGLYRDAQGVRNEMADIVTDLEGVIARENLPASETIVALHNAYGCLLVLEADMNKRDRVQKYEEAIRQFHRAMAYRTSAKEPVVNIFYAYGRLMADEAVPPARFRQYRQKFTAAMAEARYFFGQEYSGLFGAAINRATMSAAKGLFNKALSNRDKPEAAKEVMEDFIAALGLLGAVPTADEEEAARVGIQKLRIVFEMILLNKAYPEAQVPYKPGSTRPWNLQDLEADLNVLNRYVVGKSTQVEFEYFLLKGQFYGLTGNAGPGGEAFDRLDVLAGQGFPKDLIVKYLKQKPIFYEGTLEYATGSEEKTRKAKLGAIDAYERYLRQMGELGLAEEEQYQHDLERARANLEALKESLSE